MFSYIWPIALVVLSNTFYQICAKSVPGDMDPLASLTITYLVGAAVSLGLFFALNRGADLLAEALTAFVGGKIVLKDGRVHRAE